MTTLRRSVRLGLRHTQSTSSHPPPPLVTTSVSDQLVFDLAISTTKILEQSQKELIKVKWTDGESNTDTDFSLLACLCCQNAWNTMQQQNTSLRSISLSCQIPDINLTFDLGKRKVTKKIELKSSKTVSIPGSTINKLDVNQPLIWCLRPKPYEKQVFHLRCSQYHQAMIWGENDKFQDRTPRPIIHFQQMPTQHQVTRLEHRAVDHWIQHYAGCALHRLENTSIRSSWQDKMVEEIKQQVIRDFIQSTSLEQFQQLKGY